MFRDDAVALLADRLNRTDLTTRIVNEMKQAQINLESADFVPWFLMRDAVPLVTTPLVETVALPTDFIKEPEEDEAAMWLVDTTTTPSTLVEVPKNTYGNLVAKYRYAVAQQPLEYALRGMYINLLPVPDIAYTLQFSYFANAALLTSNIENLWLQYASDVLIAQTGMLCCKYPQDDKRYAMFAADYKAAMSALITSDTARREANLERFMGDADA